ncbi:hypothetical protein F4780DRAFT_102389 [Xylariomycetidae sp. FL0641]|nr:hypothetical protein F4780DRAFT_102389 [Xylariomycetidae sp. FL0641]
MVTSDHAKAAKGDLQGEIDEGRTLSTEKARRVRPRTPTPTRYFGSPKREGRRGGSFDDRRRGGYGGEYVGHNGAVTTAVMTPTAADAMTPLVG